MHVPPPACGPAEKLRVSHSWLETVSWIHCVSTGEDLYTVQLQTPCNKTDSFYAHSRPAQATLRKWNWSQTRRQLICWTREKKKTKGKQTFQLVWTFWRNKMSKPNYTGTYNMVEQDNMDAYLAALGKTRIRAPFSKSITLSTNRRTKAVKPSSVTCTVIRFLPFMLNTRVYFCCFALIF